MIPSVFSSLAWRRAGLALAGFVVAVNVIVAMHARAMLHFDEGGVRKPSPEQLSFMGKAWVVLSGITIPKPRAPRNPAALGLAGTPVSIPQPGGGALAGWQAEPLESAQAWVLMLHGYAAERSTLVPEAIELRAMGLRPFLLDFHGSGESSGAETTIGYLEADDVRRVYAHLEAQEPRLPIVLYGKSMGAAAALRAAGPLGLKPRAMVLECSFDSLLNTVRRRFALMGAPSFPFAEMLVGWGSLLYGFNGFAHDPMTYAAAVTSPTLILNGSRDLRATPDDAQRIAANLPGPHDLRIFQGAGHNDVYAHDPALWRETVRTFLLQGK